MTVQTSLIILLLNFTLNAHSQKRDQDFEWIYFSQIAQKDKVESEQPYNIVEYDQSIITGKSIDSERVINQMQVRENDIAGLMAILLDRNPNNTSRKDNCYFPTNGILFYDSSDQLVGFIELSITCNEFKAIGICERWDIGLGQKEYEELDLWFQSTFKK